MAAAPYGTPGVDLESEPLSKALSGSKLWHRQSSKASRRSTHSALEHVVVDYEPEQVHADEEKGLGGAPATTELAATINLTKNLVGSGIFTLPLALSKASVIPGLVMLVCVGILLGGSFLLIAVLCKALGASTYREMWGKAFGARSALIIDVCIVLNALLGCLAYIILVCDFFQKSLPQLFGWHPERWQLILADTLAFVLPLSYIKDLSPLRIPSMIGLFIIAYIFIYLMVDWCLHLQGSIVNFQNNAGRADFGIFFAMAVFTGAFKAHYNAPTFYRELGGDLAVYTRVVAKSFGAACAIYFFFALAGFGIWGETVQGNILNNYGAVSSVGVNIPIQIALLGMAFAVTLSYPLVFNSGRAAVYGLVPALERAKRSYPLGVHVGVTTSIVLAISGAACFVSNVQIVVGLAGATIGSALCVILPAVVHLKVAFFPNGRADAVAKLPKLLAIDSGAMQIFSFILLTFGVSIMVIGTLVVLGVIS